MKVLRKYPGGTVEQIEIENTLKALQEEVGGRIEMVAVAPDIAVVCDEEGRLKGAAHNCELSGVDFVGTVLIVGIDADEFCDAPEGARILFGEESR